MKSPPSRRRRPHSTSVSSVGMCRDHAARSYRTCSLRPPRAARPGLFDRLRRIYTTLMERARPPSSSAAVGNTRWRQTANVRFTRDRGTKFALDTRIDKHDAREREGNRRNYSLYDDKAGRGNKYVHGPQAANKESPRARPRIHAGCQPTWTANRTTEATNQTGDRQRSTCLVLRLLDTRPRPRSR